MTGNTAEVEGEARVRVLVVDDDPDIFEMLLSLAERDPVIELTGAATPEVAVALSRAEPPDVILLDHHFATGGPREPALAAAPGRGLTGLESVEFLRAAAPGAVIALYTGSSGLQDSAEHAGADVYVVKGLDPQAVLDDLADLVRGRREG
jgi:CheY-like chemotaxis protein